MIDHFQCLFCGLRFGWKRPEKIADPERNIPGDPYPECLGCGSLYVRNEDRQVRPFYPGES